MRRQQLSKKKACDNSRTRYFTLRLNTDLLWFELFRAWVICLNTVHVLSWNAFLLIECGVFLNMDFGLGISLGAVVALSLAQVGRAV